MIGSTPLHVVAGVLIDADGRVLLAQRPLGKHLAGCWEFPGGKLESDETPVQALSRELHEEIGIDVASTKFVHRLRWTYPEQSLLLEALRVTAWRGEPHPREGQKLRWLALADVDAQSLAPADRPILDVLRESASD